MNEFDFFSLQMKPFLRMVSLITVVTPAPWVELFVYTPRRFED